MFCFVLFCFVLFCCIINDRRKRENIKEGRKEGREGRREGCFESGCDDDSTDIHLMIPNEMTAR